MEMFRINGLSSEDLMRPGGQTSAKAFMGVMFKMGAPAPGTPAAAVADEEALAKAEADALLSGETGLTAGDADDERLTEKKLMAQTKEKLVQLAASLGVADLDQTKPKLVEAILGLQ